MSEKIYTVLECRRLAGLRQSELAKQLGISRSHLSRLESGKRAFTFRLALKWHNIIFSHLENLGKSETFSWNSVPDLKDLAPEFVAQPLDSVVKTLFIPDVFIGDMRFRDAVRYRIRIRKHLTSNGMTYINY